MEVSIILENQLNTDTSGLIPTVCRDRYDHLDNFHASEQNIFTDSVDETSDESFDDITMIDLDEIAAIISQGYEDIRASNPNISPKEDQIDLLINRVLKRKSGIHEPRTTRVGPKISDFLGPGPDRDL